MASKALVHTPLGTAIYPQRQSRTGISLQTRVNNQGPMKQPTKVVYMTLSPPKPRIGNDKSSLKPIAVPYSIWNRKSGPKVLEENKLEVVQQMEPWAAENLLPLLKSVELNWQPQDFLPDFGSSTWIEEIKAIQGRTANLPDDYLVVLVGDMITEEALPTYQTMMNTFEGTKDVTGCSPGPWAQWGRGWTAEENRHGDLLSNYLYMCGRVNMKQVQKTTQYLIGAGMASAIQNDPYNGFIYTSFQERATWISHLRTAEHAKQYGDTKLATICKMISADEKRHEIAYTRVISKVFELDPTGAMLAFEDMMKKKITMPAALMFDGQDEKLFDNYSSVAQRLGVYTAIDYVQIMEHLIGAWKVENLEGLSSEGMRAQEFVCSLPSRFRKLADRSSEQTERRVPSRKAFSWIFNKEVILL